MTDVHDSALQPGHLRAGSRLEARTIPVEELSASEIGRWRELAAAAVEPNPFFEPEFVLPLSQAVPTQGAALLAVELGGEWVAALPIRRAASWRRIPLSGTIGWRSSYTYLGAPLLHCEWVDAAAQALLANSVRGRRYLGLELLGGEGAVAIALAQAAKELGFGRTVLRAYRRAALIRRAETSEYLGLKPKHRRELRRQRDRLAEALDAAIDSRDETGSDAALTEFLRLEGSGWKHNAGTAFSSLPGHEEMFRTICRSFESLGRLQLLTLRAGERTLASKCNLIAGDGAFCFKIAFDEAWSKFSPGVQLELANIDFFHNDPRLKWMDSCAEPTNGMINRLWPDRRPIEVTAITGGGAGRAAERVFRAAVQTRDLMRRGDAS